MADLTSCKSGGRNLRDRDPLWLFLNCFWDTNEKEVTSYENDLLRTEAVYVTLLW